MVLILFFFLNINKTNKLSELAKNIELDQGIQVFTHPQCPHCHEEKKFINSIMEKYDDIEVYYYDITEKNNYNKMIKYAAKFGIPVTKLGTPIIFTENHVIIGFDKPETTGEQIKKLFDGVLEERKIGTLNNLEEKKYLELPILGQINLFETSIPILAIVMGLADGFNPCAMWVLVYLISIIAGMNDKKKIWFLVGSFVLSSGILYFLFMTAWLNAFLYIGYVKVISLFIGLFALYIGTMGIYEFIKTRGEVQCKLEDNKTRSKTIKRIKELAESKLSFISIVGIVGLAFVVNSIEFVCSAALPTIYTFILSQTELSIFMYYFYILLYTIFFMLDDLIIFGLAAFAVNKYVGTKYSKYSHIIGGLVMFFIGIYLVFLDKI
ncbi:TlpA family protein disulfide reductase [Pseudomonadota bacterium]